MALAAGTRIGPYHIKGFVGEGGMGQVYRAHDERLGRDVAIKMLRPEVRHDSERLRRFEQEARAAGSLNHPNILAIHGFESDSESPFLVSEFLEGSTLQQVIAERLPPLGRALDIVVQLARGLGAAHARGIVHRDLKPANVFLTRDGQVKILDFGLARLDPPADSVPGATISAGVQTASGAVLGTAGYMAPEQVQGHPADHRSDLFAVGAILYELVTGHRAFDGETPVDRAYAILRNESPSLAANATARVPAALERVVRRCLEKNPGQRFQSAHDLAFALEALLDESRTPSSPMAPLRAWPRPRPLVLAAAVVLVASVVGFVAGRYAPSAGPVAAPVAPSQPSFQLASFRSGVIGGGRFAPDGNTVVYNLSYDDQKTRVVTSALGAPEGRPLTEPGTRLLALSSKGEMALATMPTPRKRDEMAATLARAPLAGGAPREVMEGVALADWSPDGEELAVVRVAAGRVRLEYPIGHVLLETEGWISSMRVSPDGNRVAFHLQPVYSDDRGAIEVVDRAGHRRTLIDGWYTLQGIAWGARGDEVLFAGSRVSGLRSIHAVSQDGRVREVLAAPSTLRLCDVDKRGRLLMITDESTSSMVRRTDVLAGPPHERDLTWLDRSLAVDLSADGKRLLFVEAGQSATHESDVWIRSTDGGAAVRLGKGLGLALSPDGNTVIVGPSVPVTQIVAVPTGPGLQRPLPAGPIVQYQFVTWFSDGKRLLVAGRAAGRPMRLWIQALDGAGPEPLGDEGYSLFTEAGHTRPAGPSPDDREVLAFAIASDAGQVAAGRKHRQFVRIAVESGEVTPIEGLPEDATPVGWIAGAKGEPATGLVLAIPADPRRVRLEKLDFKSGTRALLRELSDSAPDGLGEITGGILQRQGNGLVYQVERARRGLYVVDGVR